MKMYSVKDGELECREVDADFFEKNTTLGGLLTSDEGCDIDQALREGAHPKFIRNFLTKGYGMSLKEGLYDGMIGADFGVDYDGDLTVEPLIRFPYLTSNMMATDTKDYDETDWYKSDNVQIHEKVCQELNETYEKKNADYGNSFENSLDKHGLIAGIVRMDDKMSRLISLNSKKEQQVMDESLRDTLMDLANYAIMSVMWLDEQ